jgi:predicted outer membrane protein
MSAAVRLKVGALAAGLSYLLVVGYAQAQQVQGEIKPAQYADQDTGQALRDQPMQDQTARPQLGHPNTTYYRGSNAGAVSQELDYYLANCLQIKNQAEIEANEFAQERADSTDVKQFAEQMVQDHRELGQRLAQAAGTSGQTNQATAIGQSDAQRRTASDTNPALNQLIEIDRQITARCSAMAREKLGQKSGAEFDECYVGSQIGAHMQMLAALEVISQQAGGDLRQVAQEAKTTVESHLKHAEQLAEELQSSRTEQASRQARTR